jgi:hypothetical protein
LPAPSSPRTSTTSPGRRPRASRAASASVSAGELHALRERGRLGFRKRRRRRAAAEELRDPREVVLQHLEHPRRVERGGRVKDRVERHRVAAEEHVLRLPVDLRDPGRPAREELRREVAERADQLRLDQLDLPPEVRLARFDLLRQRVPVPGRAALQDVRDVDLVAHQPDPVEQLREELARGADERHALLVLVEARCLADEHQLRRRRACAEHDLRPAACERALRAPRDVVAVGEEISRSRHSFLRNTRRRSWAVRRCRGLRTRR